MPSTKKQTDLGIFIIGWIASALAIGVPTIFLMLIKHFVPTVQTDLGDKLSIIAYLFGAFFSGLFTTYRVVCKSKEKDETIDILGIKTKKLQDDIDNAKKAYRALSPKQKIISLLLDIHSEAAKLTIDELKNLIIKKIAEINNGNLFEPRYDGMIIGIPDSDYKKKKPSEPKSTPLNQTRYSFTTKDSTMPFKQK